MSTEVSQQYIASIFMGAKKQISPYEIVNYWSLLYSSTLEMEAGNPSETSDPRRQTSV
jgi:hypothetical protein